MKGQLGIYEFGRQLLETQDLDPVYVVAHGAGLSGEKLKRWLLAYWCFYHVGSACVMAEREGEAFWELMAQAAASKEWPRGTERRHFRGKASIESVTWLRTRGFDGLWGPLSKAGYVYPLHEVMNYVRSWYLFGDWIAFKAADMLERLGLCQVYFPPESVFSMFDAPKKGAAEMALRHGPSTGEVCRWAHDRLLEELGTYQAPPGHDRSINVQEVETILCKWKSHLGGHYEIGKDTSEVQHGLLRYARCKTAQALIRGGREGGLW